MIWQSFFAGATAMLFVFLLAFIWIRHRIIQGERERQDRHMEALHEKWEERNRLAEEQNQLLTALVDRMPPR